MCVLRSVLCCVWSGVFRSVFVLCVLQTRREAMHKLNKIITGDIFNNDHWSQLKKNLTELMADPDEELTVGKSFYLSFYRAGIAQSVVCWARYPA